MKKENFEISQNLLSERGTLISYLKEFESNRMADSMYIELSGGRKSRHNIRHSYVVESIINSTIEILERRIKEIEDKLEKL